ncbi:polysaccharide biosynthesis protein [Chitinophaga cymbidii]|uniref:Nucleoside-diphosphate sugar epimerase n=1 Tax=Chitinophaga cymbidii TaxID=1096750 RepID=A0A512RGF5_9BACT|nr:polysaccharide biosynthesis protein [Chitinophaga cymbidii]GEP94791.1 nucleoside-diphosphate sugar epimerase [Chitinophaga cymbidii]
MSNNITFHVENFIRNKVVKRTESLLKDDLEFYHDKLQKEVEGKKVLVIGGAGTIGSSYVKAILKYSPSKVIVVDTNENGLTELVRDCRSTTVLKMPVEFRTYPINFGDTVFRKLFVSEAPFNIVANFAAHKHVRSEKDIFSIEAMIENNVIKAKKLLDLLVIYPPAHFFCVSTDKAANPVNIMGASKKLMEEVILAYSDLIPITTARFANVAFSNGSLLAGFMERLAKQQPLSCPSDVKRYFVSPQESGEICLIASLLGSSGDILFPKLNDLMKFSDIARLLLNELNMDMQVCETEEVARQQAFLFSNGKQPAYPIYLFPSDTSGEKLYEEFYTLDEHLDMKTFKNLGVIKNAHRRKRSELDNIIQRLEENFIGNTPKESLVKLLQSFMPTFQHIETGYNLDQKM